MGITPGPGQVALNGWLICASTADITTVRAHLPAHLYASRAEPGCLQFDIRQTEDPLIWQVSELFRDKTAWQAHKARTAASPWAAATAHLRRDIQPSEG